MQGRAPGPDAGVEGQAAWARAMRGTPSAPSSPSSTSDVFSPRPRRPPRPRWECRGLSFPLRVFVSFLFSARHLLVSWFSHPRSFLPYSHTRRLLCHGRGQVHRAFAGYIKLISNWDEFHPHEKGRIPGPPLAHRPLSFGISIGPKPSRRSVRIL